jgi:BspA type Leucine rich repeat region (6 copies)
MKTNLIQTCLLVAVLLALPAVVQAQFTYTTANGTITITGYTGSGGDVMIPATINGLPVTSIGDGAFAATFVDNVTIPNSVTNIGEAAFADCNLTNIMISASVIHIGDQTFYDCFGLSAINVNAGNLAYSSVDGVLFDKNLMTLLQYPIAREGSSYTISNNVTSIGDLAFADSSLSQVSIGNGVTNIGWDAFQYCQSLTNITIPAVVDSIGADAFDSCTSLSAINVNAGNLAYSSVDGVLFDKNQATLLLYPIARGGSSYTISNNVTSIPVDAFADSALTNITIPDSVTNLSGAFHYCTSLAAINVDAANPAYSSVDGVLFDKSQTMLLQCPRGKPGHYTIPASVTSINGFAFGGCSLTEVTIPGSVTYIGEDAFISSLSLTNFFFEGNSPSTYQKPFDPPDDIFGFDFGTVYYLPGSAGWYGSFSYLPTELWQPQVQTTDASFGVRSNQFGFNINWASGQTVVVEACTNLANPVWQPFQTNTLTSDSIYFSDPQWANYPARFYRLSSP